ncbi:BrnT family toxin [Candidatus Berkelbacteria bacterium]|nr:BrnT family toxin [Candidatus Berkelbacteria bacterium]
MRVFKQPFGFEWDNGNKDKNLIKHRVTDEECEEVFFDEEKKVLRDIPHSDKEERYIFLGKTKTQRLLFVVFVIRNNKIRIISGRAVNKKERSLYEKKVAGAFL